MKTIFNRKYPVVRQYDQIDCGPAALLSVLKYCGGDSSIVHVRQLTKTDAHGANMLGVVNAAKELGFDAYGASGEYDDLVKEKMPCIAHVIIDNRLQHFVVIYEIDEKGVLIGDPGKGLHRLSREQFLEIWQQKAVILLTPKKEELFNQSPPNWLRWIFSYFQKEEAWLTQSLFLGIIYTLLGLLVAVFVQWLIDKFIPEKNTFKIVITGVFLLALQLTRALAGFLRRRFLVELNKRVTINVNKDFLSHIFHLPLTFFDSRKKGDITARINDSIKVQQALLQIFGVTVIDGLIVVGSFVFLFLLAPPLAWIAIATLPFYSLILLLATKRIKDEQNEVMKSYAQVESFYFDSLGGINEILSFNVSSAFAKLNRLVFEGFQNRTAKLGFTQAGIILYAELAAGALVMGVLSFGAVLVIQSTLLLGQMMAAYSLIANMLPSINRMVEANITLQGASIAVQRLMDLLLVDKEKDSGDLPFQFSKQVKINDAGFSWPKGKLLFKRLNLTIERGKISSLWGVSGAGKSTLIKILQRKYSLNSGEILIDSIPAENFELNSYRKNIAVVPQNVKIFNETILQNILVGRPVDDLTEVTKRIDDLGLAAFFQRFEAGVFTLIGEEGRELSSGETQVVGLIRALFDTPEVLILDESISTIDVEIENFIFDVLRDYARTHAILVISHNLRTIVKTDYVHLLEEGVITRTGPPEDLLQSSERFRTLWNIQQSLPKLTQEENHVI